MRSHTHTHTQIPRPTELYIIPALGHLSHSSGAGTCSPCKAPSSSSRRTARGYRRNPLFSVRPSAQTLHPFVSYAEGRNPLHICAYCDIVTLAIIGQASAPQPAHGINRLGRGPTDDAQPALGGGPRTARGARDPVGVEGAVVVGTRGSPARRCCRRRRAVWGVVHGAVGGEDPRRRRRGRRCPSCGGRSGPSLFSPTDARYHERFRLSAGTRLPDPVQAVRRGTAYHRNRRLRLSLRQSPCHAYGGGRDHQTPPSGLHARTIVISQQ
jgi:hypothetical protein